MKKLYLVALPLIILIGIGIMTLIPMNTSQIATISGIEGVTYHSSVCPVIEKASGEVVTYPCSHNLLYDVGKNNTIEMVIMGSNNGAFKNISLINATAGVDAAEAGGNPTWVPYVDCNLSSVVGATTRGNHGNITISYTFTNTCDGNYLNATKLTNQTGGLLAGNTFPISLLNTGDRFTQTWIVWVE